MVTEISSNFAILDVKKGRAKLAKHFEKRPALGPCPEELKLPVTIKGYIDGIHGHDDGVSREFSVDVTEAVLGLDQKAVLWQHCLDFIEKQEIGCAETVHQTDRVIVSAYEFIEGICNIVGYHKSEDDE